MKAIKRTVAALLATLMLATSTSFTLAAEEYTDAEAVVVAKVGAAGIMTGTDKGFEPSKSLTRAEAAAIIVRMKGISESATKAAAGTTLFNDVAASHWASGYVNQASNLGIVKGVSATEFAPDREVLISEFVTMAVRALGAGQLVDSQGVWPINYINFANENKILDDVNAIYTATATRIQAATIVANTLEAIMWEKTGVKSNGEIEWGKTAAKDTILDDVLNIEKYENVKLTVINEMDRKVTAVWVKDNTLAIAKDVADRVDLTVLNKATEYDLWYDKDDKEIVGIWKAEDSKQDTAEFTKISSTLSANKIKLAVAGKDVEYKFADTFSVYYNGDHKANNDTTKLAKNDNIFGSVVLDADGKIASIIMEEYNKIGLVKEVNAKSIYFNTSSDVKVATEFYTKASSLPINEDNYEYSVKKDGKAISISDIEEDDVVFYYETTSDAGNKKYVIAVITDKVTGEVTSVGDKTFKMDGEKYDTTAAVTAVLNPDSTIEGYKNAAGKVVMFKEVEEGNDDLAIVKSFRVIRDTYDDYRYEVVLTSLDGTDTEAMVIDIDETEDACGSTITLTGKVSELYAAGIEYLDGDSNATTDKDEVARINTKSLVGTLVKYTTKGGKVVLNEFVDFATPTTVYTKESDNDKKIKYFTSRNYDDDTMRIYSSDVNTYDYVLTEDTKVVRIKMVSDLTEEKAGYSFKTETIKAEELGDVTGSAFAGYVAGFSADDKTVEALVLLPTATVKHSVEKVYGLLSSKSSIKGDDDYNSELTFLTADGKVEVKSTKQASSFTKGYIYEIVVNGEELEESTQKSTVLTPDTALYNVTNKLMRLQNKAIVNLAEKALFVSVDVDGKYEIGNYSDLTLISEAAMNDNELISGIDHSLVKYLTVANEDTSVDEAVIIVYKKEVVDGVLTTISNAITAATDNGTDAISTAAVLAGADSSINGLVVTYTAKDGYVFDTEAAYTVANTTSSSWTGSVTTKTANKIVVTYVKP